eukprot:scaffold16833_cov101-Isochrysis_galbana.AAC.1
MGEAVRVLGIGNRPQAAERRCCPDRRGCEDLVPRFQTTRTCSRTTIGTCNRETKDGHACDGHREMGHNGEG